MTTQPIHREGSVDLEEARRLIAGAEDADDTNDSGDAPLPEHPAPDAASVKAPEPSDPGLSAEAGPEPTERPLCQACGQDTLCVGVCRLPCFWWSNAGQCPSTRSCHYLHHTPAGTEVVLATVCDMALFVTPIALEDQWWPCDTHFRISIQQLGEDVAARLLAGCNNGMIVRAGDSLRFPASCMLRAAPGSSPT